MPPCVNRRCIAVMTVIPWCMLWHGCGKSPANQPVKTGEKPAESSPTPWFSEEAAARGVEFHHDSGHRDRYFIPENACGGVAVFDMDGDGDLDLYMIQSGNLIDPAAPQPRSRLFRNRGDGHFDDVSDGSGADISGYGMGVATGDIDNDGDVDLYITNVGPNVLLRNDGHGHFTDVTASARVGDPGFGSSAAFVDYDRDGNLDLFVANYLIWSVQTEKDCFDSNGKPDYCGPSKYNSPAYAVLYHNNGDGTFTDVSIESGIAAAPGTGLGVVCGDFTGDGWPDIFVANDEMPDRLWVNLRDGRFADEALSRGCAVDLSGTAKAGMGVIAMDIDDDLDLDLMVCNLTRESDSLFRNEAGHFNDVTATAGLGAASRTFTRFGMGMCDFDNDGFADLYQANGRIGRLTPTYSDDPYAEPNLLFRGTASGRFAEVQPRGGTLPLLCAASRGAAFGDLDNDGGVDVVVANRDGSPHLLHNVVHDRGHWIMLHVIDEHGRDALGATVTLTVGGRTISRDVRTAYSYLSANDPRIHIGLGELTSVSDISVRWADGASQQFGTRPADTIVDLRRGR